MNEFKTLYHGTTIDKLENIAEEGTIPMFRPDTGFTGAWATRLLEKSIEHAKERGIERGGIEPVVLEYSLPQWWIEIFNNRPAVDTIGYDENVYCFKAPLPQLFLQQVLYPNR